MPHQKAAALRRGRDFPYLKGSVIDIGGGGTDLSKYYDGITEFKSWDLVDGDAMLMSGCPEYDCVHSSHCLEHLEDPAFALRNWVRVARKYLVILVPDEEMYERMHWPSQFNGNHLWSFHTNHADRLPKSISVLRMINLLDDVEVIKIERLVAGFDPTNPIAQAGAECEGAIEFILKKV